MVKREREEADDVAQDVELSSGTDENGDDEEVYVVEKIINHKKDKSGSQYLIKWEGYPDSENTWEDEENVFDKELIKQYWDSKQKGKKANGKASAPTSPTQAKRRRADEKPAVGADGPEDDDWEPLIDEIKTVDRAEDGSLVVFIDWKSGVETEHSTETVYKKCPQAMLKFYEERLRFRAK